ncbi:hypothetical protein ACWGII_37870 [Streptomyces sp. NPDC054855]
MSSAKTQATAIASMLTSVLGAIPCQDATDERIRLEVEVPDSLGESERLAVLDFLLGQADRFGHSLHKDGTSAIWAEVDSNRRSEA